MKIFHEILSDDELDKYNFAFDANVINRYLGAFKRFKYGEAPPLEICIRELCGSAFAPPPPSPRLAGSPRLSLPSPPPLCLPMYSTLCTVSGR